MQILNPSIDKVMTDSAVLHAKSIHWTNNNEDHGREKGENPFANPVPAIKNFTKR